MFGVGRSKNLYYRRAPVRYRPTQAQACAMPSVELLVGVGMARVDVDVVAAISCDVQAPVVVFAPDVGGVRINVPSPATALSQLNSGFVKA